MLLNYDFVFLQDGGKYQNKANSHTLIYGEYFPKCRYRIILSPAELQNNHLPKLLLIAWTVYLR
jgi:hypothetical protein